MKRLYINQTLQREIEEYCNENGIEDVNAFSNRCASKGFSILKFGISPIDNMKREMEGVKDFKEDKKPKPKKEKEETPILKEEKKEEETVKHEEPKPIVRKIQIIKKL